MFLLNIKRFVKTPVFVFGTIGYIIVLLYMLNPFRAVEIGDMVSGSMTMLPFSFLFFLIFSYEFFYQVKANKLEEVIVSSPIGLAKEKGYSFLPFLCLDSILYLLFLGAELGNSIYKFHIINKDWFLLVAEVLFINHFLIYLFASLAGCIISFIDSRIKAFAVLVGVFSLFSKVLLPLIMSIVSGSEMWCHVLDILGIMNRNYYYISDEFTMYSVESVDIQRVLFWVFLALSILCIVINRGKRRIIAAFMFIIACTVFGFYIQPAGNRYTGGYWDNTGADDMYYSQMFKDIYSEVPEIEKVKGIARNYQEADFKVLSYTGKLSAKRVLEASIDVAVDQWDKESYCFTLYHGYRVKRVTDEQGGVLSFEQDGDHVLITNNPKREIKSVHFEYSGYSRKYIATRRAVFLGGNFPYLPQAGWKEYMSEPVVDEYGNIEYRGEINLKGIGYKVKFDIQFDTDYPMYSNLTEKENSQFVGESEGATFVASPFIKEIKVNNCTLYYSILDHLFYKDNIQKTKMTYEMILDEVLGKESSKELKIFDVGRMGDGSLIYSFASDHIVANNCTLISDFYPNYVENGEIPNPGETFEDGKEGEMAEQTKEIIEMTKKLDEANKEGVK